MSKRARPLTPAELGSLEQLSSELPAAADVAPAPRPKPARPPRERLLTLAEMADLLVSVLEEPCDAPPVSSDTTGLAPPKT